MRTALNLSIDKHRIRVSHGEEVLIEDVLLVDLRPPPEDVLLAKERMARLSLALSRLTPKTREIFLAHRLEGMSYQEIAKQFGLSISTVEAHVAKATLRLTDWMKDW